MLPAILWFSVSTVGLIFTLYNLAEARKFHVVTVEENITDERRLVAFTSYVSQGLRATAMASMTLIGTLAVFFSGTVVTSAVVVPLLVLIAFIISAESTWFAFSTRRLLHFLEKADNSS